MRGSASSARAIEISCRSPAERPGAALAHLVCEPAVQASDQPVEADRARGLAHLGVGRLGAAEADVVGDRAREQERVLQHDAELAPVARELHLAQVRAVDSHRA